MKDKLIRIFRYFFSVKFLLFVLGGGVSYGLKVLFSWLFSEKLQWAFFFAYAITLILVILYNFSYNVLVTFRVKGGLAGRFLRYVILVGCFNGIDYLSVLGMNRIFSWNYQINIFLVTGFLMIVKFFVFDRIVFHDKGGK